MGGGKTWQNQRFPTKKVTFQAYLGAIAPLTSHCWLEDFCNYKNKSPQNSIARYFWYLWAFLTLRQASYFWYVFGFQVALQSFLLKVGILSWNFLWTILLWKKSALQAWETILCPKNVQKSQKIEIKNYVNVLKWIESTMNGL